MPDRGEVHAERRRVRQRERREATLFVRRLGVLLALLLALTVIGTVGFVAVEHVSVGYGFDWTVDTLTTLGSIPDPHSSGARVLKVFLELLGIGTLFYGLATVAEFFVSGQLSGLLEERRIQKMIDSYSDHYIICGFGRVGRQVARDLRRVGAPFVVIDGNPEHREEAAEQRIPYIENQASQDEVLEQAGIERARSVIACVDSDAENIFIALTARELRDDILIIARASAEDSEKKLLRAGADRVISPYKTSGREMARVALHPQVGGAVDVDDYRMEEIEVSPSCEAVGQQIEAVRGASIIVALRHPDGSLEPQPPNTTILRAGDKLVALGTPDALERLEDVFQPVSAPTA
jgi:voltage-gated potassium channel